MGGRGASSKSSSFAIKTGDGSIFQYRKIKSSDNLEYSSSGLMYREFGKKNWQYTRETRADITKSGNKLYSLKSKTVNPKNYINSDQRWKNSELKTRLKDKRSGTKKQTSSQNSKVVGYKNGRRVIEPSYKRSQMKYALGAKRAELQDAKLRSVSPLFGKTTKSEKRRAKKLEHGIRSLERQLKGLN